MAVSVPRRPAADAPLNWRPCPMCWGQRKILVMDEEGTIVGQGQCSACMGHGEVMAWPERDGREAA